MASTFTWRIKRHVFRERGNCKYKPKQTQQHSITQGAGTTYANDSESFCLFIFSFIYAIVSLHMCIVRVCKEGGGESRRGRGVVRGRERGGKDRDAPQG